MYAHRIETVSISLTYYEYDTRGEYTYRIFHSPRSGCSASRTLKETLFPPFRRPLRNSLPQSTCCLILSLTSPLRPQEISLFSQSPSFEETMHRGLQNRGRKVSLTVRSEVSGRVSPRGAWSSWESPHRIEKSGSHLCSIRWLIE